MQLELFKEEGDVLKERPVGLIGVYKENFMRKHAKDIFEFYDHEYDDYNDEGFISKLLNFNVSSAFKFRIQDEFHEEFQRIFKEYDYEYIEDEEEREDYYTNEEYSDFIDLISFKYIKAYEKLLAHWIKLKKLEFKFSEKESVTIDKKFYKVNSINHVEFTYYLREKLSGEIRVVKLENSGNFKKPKLFSWLMIKFKTIKFFRALKEGFNSFGKSFVKELKY